jgi:hypothetical protein
MCRIRDAGKVKARDRIAVLASLNLAFELSPESESQLLHASPHQRHSRSSCRTCRCSHHDAGPSPEMDAACKRPVCKIWCAASTKRWAATASALTRPPCLTMPQHAAGGRPFFRRVSGKAFSGPTICTRLQCVPGFIFP